MDQVKRLSGKKVAILVASGFEEAQMTDTQKALIADGATAPIVSSEIGLVNGWHQDAWGHNFFVEVKVGDVLPSQYDGVLVPGGARSINNLSDNAHARRILKGMTDAGKAVGVVGDAARLLAAVDGVAGRTIAADPEVRQAVEAGGGQWSDDPVAVDGYVVSSPGGEELPAFIEAFLDAIDNRQQTAADEAA